MGYVPLLETMGTKLLAVHHKIPTLETSWFAPHTLCEAGGFLVRVRSESTSRSTQKNSNPSDYFWRALFFWLFLRLKPAVVVVVVVVVAVAVAAAAAAAAAAATVAAVAVAAAVKEAVALGSRQSAVASSYSS